MDRLKAVALVALLAAAAAHAQAPAAPADQPVKLAALVFQGANVEKTALAFFTEHYGQQMVMAGVQVVTPEQIAALVGFERQKELMGCGEESASCLAELGNALGVDGLVTGSVGKFGGSYQLNLRVLSASTGQPLAVASSRVGSETGVLDELTRLAQAQARDLQRQLHRKAVAPSSLGVASTPPVRPAAIRPRSNFPMVPVIGGSALALLGGLFVATAVGADWSDVERPVATRNTTFALGALMLAGGGALIYVPVRGYLQDQKELERAARVGVAVGPGGGGVVVAGRF